MLKPMKPKTTMPKNLFLWALVGLLVLSGIIALITAFSSGGDSEDEVNAVYTNAAATLESQQLTLQASVPSSTPTAIETPTATFTALASPTLFTSPLISTNTPGTGGTGGVSGAVGCNNSAYVSDVTFPDDTVVTPGQTFTKTWKLQNTGSCPWTTSYKVSFVSGNAMGGTTTPLTVTVAPGATGDVSVAMTAPATAGDAIGYWILTSDGGQNFGTSFYVKVKVGGTATTGTAVTGTPGTTTATATSSVPTPVAANDPRITLSCTPNGTQYEYTGELVWDDRSDNEQGFNIYINNVLADIAPPNTVKYTIQAGNPRIPTILYDADTVVTYSVVAFNAGGSASPANVTGKCP